ncbi:MAG: glycine--tRNA ligase subunit beta [Magnetospirillum sp. WYHS-4]
MAELLLELYSEEIPARMQARAADDLKRLVTEGLKAAGLAFAKAESHVTPRRLALAVDGLPTAQPDVREEKRGPRVDAPQNAIDGFLKSSGLTLDQCEKRDTGKGVFWFAVIEKKGGPTAAVLPAILEKAMADLPWPKSMRWGANPERWVRPLHSIVCLFDGTVAPVSFGAVRAGETTRGHRFLAPDAFTVTDFAGYKAKLRAAKVILDAGERRALILKEAERLAESRGFRLKRDEGLLDEVTGLVEWPVVLMGHIDVAFMDVPPEVLTTAMRAHQKYFSVLDQDGTLAPVFIVVANTEAAEDNRHVIAGNERVLRARLSDAKFFWDQDRKNRLESRLPALGDRIFYAGLGSMADKAKRISELAGRLCHYIDGADRTLAMRAGGLSKADLASGMVGEFPELQGIMGRYYALADSEHTEVAEAVAEHYSPLGPNDRCPTKPVSVAVALADKLDTLAGFWMIGEKPTGSKDPFALRRAALGVIRLVIENGLRLPLLQAFADARAGYAGASEAAAQGADLLDFFADRLKVHLKEKGVRHDLVAAVFAVGGEDDLVRLLARVEALKQFLDSDDGANLLVAFRRAANILRIEEKKDGRSYDEAADESRLAQDEEKTLFAALADTRRLSAAALEEERFAEAMAALARLRQPVDAFFDHVTVNSDDKDLRTNRLRLLSYIRSALAGVADFSRIEGGQTS